MKNHETMTFEEYVIKEAHLDELYNQLTPENKAKARAKVRELLQEQENEAHG